MTDEQNTPEVPADPKPFLEGSFAMFATPDGDVVLATHTDLMGDQVVKVPRFVVNQAKRTNPAIAQILRAGANGVG